MSKGVYNDSLTAMVAEGEGSIRITPNRAMHMNLRRQDGTEVGTAGNPLYVSATSGSAIDESSFTGGTSSISTISGVYNDAISSPTAGQQAAVRITSSRALRVYVENGGAGGTAIADESSFTAGTTLFSPIGGIYNDGVASLTVGQSGAVRLTANRSMHVTVDNTSIAVTGTITANIGTTNGLALDTTVSGLQNSIGSTTSGQKGELILAAATTAAPTYTTGQSNPLSLTTTGLLRVDGSGVTQPVSGTVTANAGTGNFNVAQSGTWTVQPGNTANTTAWLVTGTGGTFPVTGTVSSNQGAPNSVGNAWPIKVTDGTDTAAVAAASTPAAATDQALVVSVSPNSPATVVQATASNLNTQAVGSIANGSADAGNPVKIGAYAVNANRTRVSNGNRSDITCDLAGRQIVTLNHCREQVASQTTTITASVSETTIVTVGAAGVFNDLTCLTITNSSGSSLIVTLKDSTGGTTRGIYALAAGGGVAIHFPTPKAQSSAAANWTLTCGTSVSSIYVVAEYVKNT